MKFVVIIKCFGEIDETAHFRGISRVFSVALTCDPLCNQKGFELSGKENEVFAGIRSLRLLPRPTYSKEKHAGVLVKNGNVNRPGHLHRFRINYTVVVLPVQNNHIRSSLFVKRDMNIRNT